MSATKKTWTPTRYRNLYRHKSGTYYVRIGTKTWKSLRTKLLSIAVNLKDEVLREEEAKLEAQQNGVSVGGDEVRHLITYRTEQLTNDPSIKDSTLDFWGHMFRMLEQSWPELNTTKVEKITPLDCERWAKRYSASTSASTFNHTLSALVKIFEIGIEAGLRHTNPAAKIKRQKEASKDLTTRLPNPDQFSAWIQEIEKSPSRWGKACAELVEFLSYSGLRIGEAKWVEWRHCDFERGEIVVEGDPQSGTKNRNARRVPMIQEMKDLLARMRKWRGHEDSTTRVLLAKSAQKAMDRAAGIVGMERLTHHDLRHFFATTCIESGVDILTLSHWLGHQDGGALAMRTYGHLRNEHSLAEAKKVTFRKVLG